MDRTPRKVPSAVVMVVSLILLIPLVVSGTAFADEVLDWNVAGLEIAIAGGQNPIIHSRTLAMVHLAIHDALNAIDRRHEPYLYEGRAEPNAAAGAAVAAAARDVMAGVILVWGNAEQRAKALAMSRTTGSPWVRPPPWRC